MVDCFLGGINVNGANMESRVCWSFTFACLRFYAVDAAVIEEKLHFTDFLVTGEKHLFVYRAQDIHVIAQLPFFFTMMLLSCFGRVKQNLSRAHIYHLHSTPPPHHSHFPYT
nr:hypothetical protein Iba_chr15aCG12850 [Ipomoea batatas]